MVRWFKEPPAVVSGIITLPGEMVFQGNHMIGIHLRHKSAAGDHRVFGVLIVVQAAHSIEEHVFRLHEVFGPARFVSEAIGSSPAEGFAAVNIALILFGLLSYLYVLGSSSTAARIVIWVWAGVEAVNGAVHIAIAVIRSAYFPGVYTAPLLLALSIILLVHSHHHHGRTSGQNPPGTDGHRNKVTKNQ